MIRQPEHVDALFVFNDNEEEFRAHQHHAPDSHGCGPGGGNAAVRPYQCDDPPRAAGSPTGSHGAGYARLDAQVRLVLDDALGRVATMVATGRFTRLYYSVGDDPDDLGTGIFTVGPDVRRYIVAGLRALGTPG
jgi:hypothetical protein